MIEKELKRTKHKNLGILNYRLKKRDIWDRLYKKEQDNTPLTEVEGKLKSLFIANYFLTSGRIPEAVELYDVGNLSENLDHKECLQLLFDYEKESILAFFELYEKMIIQEGNQDFEARRIEFEKLVEERSRMESLEAYTVEKLGAAYNELPEEEKYHPLILFLNKALTQENEKSRPLLYSFYRNIYFDFPCYLLYFVDKEAPPDALENLKKDLRKEIGRPVYQDLFKSGIKFDVFED